MTTEGGGKRKCELDTETKEPLLTRARQDSASSEFDGYMSSPRAPRKLAVGMVGLPARGKTYMAQKLAYYLNWMQIPTTVFNHGNYRRKRIGGQQSAMFFHPNNEEGMQKRMEFAKEALNDMFEYFDEGGQIGILDATNSSRSRRDMVVAECKKKNIDVFWVESICEDADTIDSNIRGIKVKLPEYAEMPVEDAVRDFKERIDYYRSVYETLDPDGAEKDESFIQIKDLGRRFFVSRPKGILTMRIVRYLMNVHIRPRSIYLTRHGESLANKVGKLGGDSGLSPAGLQYARALKVFMNEQNIKDLQVWTSSLKRTVQTSIYFLPSGVESFKALDELDTGECDNLTYEEICQKHPQVAEGRAANKYFYRYPRGESYRDVVERLEPMIVELERQEDVLVITHQAICRCLLSYFKNIPRDQLEEQLPYLEVPLHTVIKVTPYNDGCKIEHYKLGPTAVNTHIGRRP